MKLSCNRRELLEAVNTVMPALAGPAFPGAMAEKRGFRL